MNPKFKSFLEGAKIGLMCIAFLEFFILAVFFARHKQFLLVAICLFELYIIHKIFTLPKEGAL